MVAKLKLKLFLTNVSPEEEKKRKERKHCSFANWLFLRKPVKNGKCMQLFKLFSKISNSSLPSEPLTQENLPNSVKIFV